MTLGLGRLTGVVLVVVAASSVLAVGGALAEAAGLEAVPRPGTVVLPAS